MELIWKEKCSLSESEQAIVNSLTQSVLGDLAQGSGETGTITSKWYKTEFEFDISKIGSKYAVINFKEIKNLRKTRFFLNGHEIGNNTCSHAEAVYAFPSEFLEEKNSLMCIVDEGAVFGIWLPQGHTPYIPEGYTEETKELPKTMQIYGTSENVSLKCVKFTGNSAAVNFTDGKKAEIQFRKNGIIRFNYNPQKKLADEIILDEYEKNTQPDNSVKLLEDENAYIFTSDALSLKISKKDGAISVFNLSGKLLTRQSLFNAEGLCGMSVELQNNEHIFGLGENATPRMDKRGLKEDIWISHDFVKCDAPIPFYISTGGYGFYLNTTYRSIFDMGYMKHEKGVIYSLCDSFDFFIFDGEETKKAVSSFVSVTGKTILPPKWAFGYWQAGFNVLSKEGAENDIKKYKELGIPLDVLCIDPGWQRGMCDLTWNEKNFPNYKEFIKFVKDNGIKMILWTAPFVNPECDWFKDGSEKGVFFRDKDGKSAKVQWWMGYDTGLLDFTNPKATEWWANRLDKLIEEGADGFKIDGGDNGEFPYDVYSKDGIKGSELHNAYAIYFAKVYHEILKKHFPNKRVVTWERTAFTGSGKYPCTWGGDQFADFGGTQVLIKAGQMAGLCGLPFWSQDVGGFCGCKGTNEEFFIRSYQWGCISPLSRAHGGKTEPWSYSDVGLKVAEKYIKLRYKLLPYIYSLSYKAYSEGIPIMRPMVYDYLNDENVYSCDYQYFFGENIMVAPIYEENGNADFSAVREIYLPKGRWIDFNTNEIYDGGKYITYKAAADILPMFIKEGAIIPQKDGLMHAEDYSIKDTEIYIYPSMHETSFSLYDDDGESDDYKNGIYNMIELKAQDSEITVTDTHGNNENAVMEFHVFADKEKSVFVNGEKIESSFDGNFIIFNITHKKTEKIELR